MFRVMAALYHRIPCVIYRTFTVSASIMAMLCKKCGSYFFVQTTATLRLPTHKLICPQFARSSAVALTSPMGTRMSTIPCPPISSKGEDRPSAKSLPCQIFRLLMKCVRILLRHARLLVSRVVFRGTALYHQCCFPAIIACSLVIFLLFPHTVYTQSVQSGPELEPPAMQQCTDQLLAAQQHVTLVVQRRDRDEQTIAELVVRIQKLQHEVDRLKKDAQKPTDTP